MKKIILVLLQLSLLTPPSQAQHWEGVGGGTDQQPHIVRGMLEFNNKLVIGGAFDSLGYSGIVSMGFGYWNNQNWVSGNTIFFSGYPNCFAEYQGSLYVGGEFSRINGNKYCRKIARLDSNGVWQPLGSGITTGTEVTCMAEFNGDLYVAGQFGVVDSTINALKIARWDGSSWHAIGTGIQGSFGVNDMTVFQNQLYVGGVMTSANGVQTSGIGRWNGTTWDSLGTGLNGPAKSLFADTINNRLYVGGQFTTAGGVSTPTGVAYWDGLNWFAVGTVPYLNTRDLIVYQGILYNTNALGSAINANGDTLKYISWFDGVNWNPLLGGLSSSGLTLLEFQNELYVGGYFQYAGDSIVNGIAKWIPGSLGMNESAIEKPALKITPNPAKDEVELEFYLTKETELKLKITDINGKEIKEDEFSGNGKIITKINTSSCVSGVYVFSVYDGLQLLGSEKVVIER